MENKTSNTYTSTFKGKIIFLVYLNLFSVCLAQTNFSLGPRLSQIIQTESTPDFIRFKPNSYVSVNTFFDNYREDLGLGIDDDMILRRVRQDEIGFTHYRFQQTHKGVAIEHGIFILHERNGSIETANGEIIRNLNIDVSPILSESEALQRALDYVGAQKYLWENEEEERLLKEETGNPDTTYFPKGELLIAHPVTNELITDSFRLAYKFIVIAEEPYGNDFIYVNAMTGEIFKTINRVHNCSYGSAYTLYNGWQTITTKWRNRIWPLSDDYILEDLCRGDGIHTKIRVNKFDNDVNDGDNNWSLDRERPATSAHWAGEMTYDYYDEKHSRNSIDGNGRRIKLIFHRDDMHTPCVKGKDPVDNNNACWEDGNDKAHFGKGDGSTARELVSLDVVAHEITHGVTIHEANLEYNDRESGALNESFSDIFGTMVEFYAVDLYGPSGTADYDIGEDVWIPTGRLRSMYDPESAYSHQPDTYGAGPYWYGSNVDPHHNSSIQNKWFYLLAEGGSDVNDLGNEYCVQGIGREKTANIAYRNLTQYLTSSSNYAAARNGSIQAAIDLYGANSNEVAQVISAWYAVGVGTIFNGIIEINSHTVSGTEVISYNNEIVFNNLQVPNATSLTVTSNTIITMNPVSFASSGSYFHAYIAPACTGGAIPPPFSGGNNYQNSDNDSTNLSASSDSDVPKNKFSSNNYLSSTYPNPFREQSFIQYSITHSSPVHLSVYNIFGQQVATLVSHPNQEAGVYQVTFNAGNLPSGIYFYTLRAGNFMETKKMVLMK